MSRTTISIILGIIVLAGGFAGYRYFRSANESPYQLATVQRGDLVQEVLASGRVAPPDTIDLQFKNSGKLTVLNAVVGQKVTAGKILARQDINVLSGELNQLEAALKNQEYKLKSLKKNDVKDHNDKYDRKAQEALVEEARADIKVQTAKIGETILVSPVEGTITEVNGEAGEIAEAGTIVVSIASSGNLQIDVDISEADIAGIKIGQEARITLDAFENQKWAGNVSKIDPAETIVGGAVYYKTTVLLTDNDERIKSGMTANVWIKSAHRENVLYVPAEAVKAKRGSSPIDSRSYSYVQVLEGKQVKEREAQTGMKSGNGMIEIISGLNEGEQAIISKK